MKKMHLPRLLGVYSSLLLSTFLLSYSASAQVVTYCVPEGTNPNRYINDFSTNGGDQSITNNGSGFSADGYGDYTGLTAEQGYGGSVNFNASFEGGTAGFRIWVDWNHDGFFDTDEVAYQSNSYSTSHSGSVSVPASAMLGSTRMRIVSHWYSISGVVDPCETDFPYGEFEDYTFVVASEASWDCPDLETNFGDACDDGDPNTVDDTVTEDCGCEGIPVATNDEACTATAIACDDVIVQSLMEATSSMEDGCDGTGSVDVWFSFTCNGSQTYTIGETSSFDAVVQLFMGDDCNNLTEAGSCSDPNEEYEITDAGTYYFRVRPYFARDDEGTITVSLICGGYDCPELGLNIGDACDDGDPGTYDDTLDAGCNCVGTPYGCPDLEANIGDACNDGDPNTANDTVTEDCGCVGIPVATNDEACSATVIACHDVISQYLVGATSSMEDGCDGSGSADVWFSFISDGSHTYTIGETSSFDAVVQLFVGDDCNNLTEAGSCSDPNEEYEITDAGNYYFRVRPYYAADDEGTITVSLICGGYDCPELGADIGDACDDGDPGTENDTVTEDCDCVGQLINDDCDGAIPLECGQPIPGTTIGATSYGLVLDNQCDGWAMGSPLDVWYFFEADGTSNYTVTVSSTDPDWDGVLFFYSGDCTGLVYEACADNAYPYRDPESITLEGLEIGTYYVRTYSWGTTGKSFTIELTCLSFCPELEANIGDACDDGDSGTYNDTVDENCDCVGILFDCYELEANIGDACDDGDLGTYNDVLDEGCNCVGISYDCQILQANIGDTCDDGDAATFGDYVNEDCECIGQPNDECVGAVMLECGHSSLGTSFGATPSVVELDNFCDGNSLNGDDVWYSFEANGTANYTITVSSTDLGWDGVLFVYSGDCADLVYEACSDNAPYPYYGPESITLEGLETGTYYVRTYNWGTTGKSFTIELTCECPALEANIGDACDDGDPETENDTVTEDCECVGTVIYDCPELEANIGDACDDGDPNTENDAVTEDCECVGMVIYDCPALEANIGDACDDGDPSTENDTVTEDCDCVGTYVCTDPQPAVTGMWVEYIEGDGMLGHWNPVANSIACQHRLYTADNVLVNKTTQWEFEADNYLGSNWLFDYGTDYIWAIRCGCNDDPVIAGPWSTLAFNTPSGPSMISSPNPTSGISNVTFEVASEEHTTLEVYDMSGRSLEVLYNGMASPKNEYRFQFNGTGLPAGVYIYRLTTDSDVVIEKFVIAK